MAGSVVDSVDGGAGEGSAAAGVGGLGAAAVGRSCGRSGRCSRRGPVGRRCGRHGRLGRGSPRSGPRRQTADAEPRGPRGDDYHCGDEERPAPRCGGFSRPAPPNAMGISSSGPGARGPLPLSPMATLQAPRRLARVGWRRDGWHRAASRGHRGCRNSRKAEFGGGRVDERPSDRMRLLFVGGLERAIAQEIDHPGGAARQPPDGRQRSGANATAPCDEAAPFRATASR